MAQRKRSERMDALKQTGDNAEMFDSRSTKKSKLGGWGRKKQKQGNLAGRATGNSFEKG